MKTCYTAILLLLTDFVFAQIEPDSIAIENAVNQKKIFYYAQFQTGPLIGCKDCTGGRQVTQTSAVIQGVGWNRIRLGAGIGLDSYYGWQMMPLFGTFAWEVARIQDKGSVLMELQYGGSFAKLNPEFQEFGFRGAEGQRMVQVSLGYRLHIQNWRLGITIAHKYQRVMTEYAFPSSVWTFDRGWIQGENNVSTVRERFSRLALTLSIGWR